MRPLLSITVAASLLAHALLGCCTHKLHASGSSGCKHSHINLPTNSTDHGHGHRHQDEQGAHGDYSHSFAVLTSDECDHNSEPAAPHECRHQNCKWTSGDSQRMNLPEFDASFTVFATVKARSTFINPCSLTSLLYTECERSAALPMRSHLALGILLI